MTFAYIMKMTRNSLLVMIALFLILSLYNVTAMNSDYETKPMLKLSKHLFQEYDGLVRPVIDGKSPTTVTFRMLLYALLDMDTRNQRFKITTWVKMTWTDEFLTWNATEFGGIDVVHVHANKIWLPDITLHQNVQESFEKMRPNTYVIIDSNGNVTWYVPTIYGSSCRQRVRYFPFDTQVCPMRLSSWAYDGNHIQLKAEIGVDSAQSRFLDNGVWRFISVKTTEETIYYPCCPSDPFYELTYTLTFKRNAAFYVAYLILPCVFLSALSLLVFYLPPDCGEKLTLSITNLLALVVFQQLIAETMPPTGEESPLIGNFFLIMIVMVCISVVATVLVIHVGYKNTHMPRWIQVLFIDVLGKIVCLNGLTQSGNPTSDDQMSKCGHLNVIKPEVNGKDGAARGEVNGDNNHRGVNGIQHPVKRVESSVLLDISRSIAIIRNHFEQKAVEDEMLSKWRMVGMVIDRCLLLSFVAFALTVTIAMTTYVIIMSEEEFHTLTEDVDGSLIDGL